MKRTAIITGGSKGIGRACAEKFLAEGYQVISLSRSAIDLDGAIHIATDLTDPGFTDATLPKIREHVAERAELTLVHNAGLLLSDSVQTLNADSLRLAFEINVVAPATLTKALLPMMTTGSSIIYVGSTLSTKAVSNTASYVTTKHALAGLMRSTCQDLKDTGIHTACVCPGFTDTEMLREHVGHDEDILKSIAALVTQRRLIEPEEIAQTIYFCANTPVVNGALIHANLGQIES